MAGWYANRYVQLRTRQSTKAQSEREIVAKELSRIGELLTALDGTRSGAHQHYRQECQDAIRHLGDTSAATRDKGFQQIVTLAEELDEAIAAKKLSELVK